MKKAIKIIAGAVLLCSGCAAVCVLIQGHRRNVALAKGAYKAYMKEYEDYTERYNANPEYADLCPFLDREGETIPKAESME